MDRNELDAHVGGYGEAFQYQRENILMLSWYAQRLIAAVRRTGARSLLSLGIGHRVVSGKVIEELCPSLESYTIVEGFPAIIEGFRAQQPLPAQVEVVQAFFEEYRPAQPVDVVEMGFVLEHVDDPALVLRRYAGFLRPPGLLIVVVPNARSLHRLFGQAARLLPDLYALSEHDRQLGHRRYFDLGSITELVGDAGLRILAQEGVFLKCLTTSQLEQLQLPPAVISAFFEVGAGYPEIANAIYLETSPVSDPRLLTVLVVSGGGFQGLGVVKCLRDSGRIRTVLADCHETNVSRYFVEAFHRVPPVADTAAFVAALLEICAREGAGIVIPATVFELETLALHAPEFRRQGTQVAVSSAAFLRLAGDKAALYAFLAAKGLPVLPVLDLKAAPPFPLIGKPAAGWGGRGVALVRDREELERLPEGARRSLVWQEYLEGADEISVDFAIDFSGWISPLGVRRRVRTAAGFAVIADDHESADVSAVVARLAKEALATGACGLLNVQLLSSGERLVLSDVNPRLGTSAIHWRGTAANPVLHLCRSVMPDLGVTEAQEVPPPRRMVRYLEELWLERAPARLRAEAEVRAVVFDLDDTLLPQKGWILQKLRLLHDHAEGRLPADQAEFLQAATQVIEEGSPAHLFDDLAVRFGWTRETKERLIETYRASTPDRWEGLFPDVLPVLDTLRRAGLRLALLTDNPPDSQRQKLAATGLAQWFECVVFAREAGAEKPDSRGFEAVAAGLGLPPRALAMVGDNPHRDAAGALRAGWAAAYLVRRREALCAFDGRMARQWLAEDARLRVIDGLLPVLWYVGGFQPDGL